MIDVIMNIYCRFSIFAIKLDIQINILLQTANDLLNLLFKCKL